MTTPGAQTDQAMPSRRVPAAAGTSSVRPFKSASPCPICGGHERLPRGQGRRCHGFLSSDRHFAHCSREEFAGDLELENESRTFAHRLDGPCRCGVEHRRITSRSKSNIETTYDYTDEEGRLLFQVVRFKPRRFAQRRPGTDGSGEWVWDLQGVRRVLYRLPEVVAAIPAGDTVYIVEGEKDVEAVRNAGCVATCNPGGAGKWRPEYAEALKDADAVVVVDADEAGRRHARDVVRSLGPVAGRVRLMEPRTGKDVSDHLAAGHTLDELVEMKPEGREDPKEGTSLGPELVRVATVQPERVEWLWDGRIPCGNITLVDGDPGLGKSTFTLDLAARVSTGRAMPDGALGLLGGVVLVSAEDGLADTIRPRLEAAGADLERVAVLTSIRGENGSLPELPEDVLGIENAIREVRAVLLVLDPLMAFLSGHVNAHRDQHVRRALAPLARMAERARVAAVVVRHLNKGSGANPLHRGGGSIGIIGAARAGLLIARDPDTEDLRVLALVKSNLGPRMPSLGFRIVTTESGVARIEWLGESSHTTERLLAEPVTPEERSALEEAVDVLREILQDGPVESNEVRRQAQAAGIADRTVWRAKAALGVRSKKGRGGRGGWVWSLPGEPCHGT